MGPHILVSIINLSVIVIMSSFVLANDPKNKINRLFFLLGFTVSAWILSNVIADTVQNYAWALFFTRITVVWTAFLPIILNELSAGLFFAEDNEYRKKKRVVLVVSSIITCGIILASQTGLNVQNISIESWGADFTPGALYYVLLVYFLYSFGFLFLSLFRAFNASKGVRRCQARLILIGCFLTVIFSIFPDIILPLFGLTYISIFAPTGTIFFIVFIGASILKYRLFNIKIIATQIMLFLLWIFILIHVLAGHDMHQTFIEVGLLVALIIFGMVLIRSTVHTISQGRKIEELSGDLGKAYSEIQKLNEKLEIKESKN